MFTNWLTGTSGLTNSNVSSATSSSLANLSSSRLTETTNHLSTSSTATTNVPAGLSFLNSHNLTNLNSSIMSTPPDIVLEVGPAPTSVRFMAHGLVLGMHSGYLRSAIRLDERGGGGSAAGGAIVGTTSSGGGVSNVSDTIVYLTNVTPEQFAPLLTYMYTGYLDLNMENIFGVLLATHVLHMPRALEICRSYLARAQSEGYFGPNNQGLNSTNQALAPPPSASGKIIRPIASKPPITNFGFLPLPHAPIPLNPLNTTTNNITPTPATPQENKSNHSLDDLQQKDEDDDIEIEELDKHSLNNENQIPINEDEDDEDIEVFIDSNSEAEVVVETRIQKLSFKKIMENKNSHSSNNSKNKTEKTQHRKSSHHSKRERSRKGTSSSGLQIAKAPIPASQLDTSEANKVIIDVASCDGPVRFKRILNTAYGHKPENCSSNNHHSGLSSSHLPERSLQSVSLSFHQQMAKTISQQQQLQQAEESENSETSNGSLAGANVRSGSEKASGSRKIQSELFVCVYCKHTFKSQYCYQKHAKRHLNPLTLQATCVPEGKMINSKEESSARDGIGGGGGGGELQITKHQNVNASRSFYNRNSTHYLSGNSSISANNTTNSLPSSSSASSSSDYLRREVRPLDMNVQYYPCKTCGCKFPSYYFVHKHRKMCHAEEEAQQSANESNGSPAASGSNSVAVVTAAGGGGLNSEECLNSQSSD